MGQEQGRRIEMDRYGGPDVLELREAALVALAPDEVRIATIAAAVNRSDIEIRSGKWPVERPDPFPYTPGLEVLGEIADAGSEVAGLRAGDRVITMMQRLGGIHGERPGGYADRVTVRADTVAVVGEGVDPYDVAALGLAAVTALEGLRRLAPGPGMRLAVTGASGGVGSAAVSLAKGMGAEVIAVLPRQGKERYVRELGADDVLILDEATLTGRYGPRSIDAVLEVLGRVIFPDAVAALAPGGRLCQVGALTGERLDLVAWDLMQDLVLTGFSSENLTGDGLRADIDDLVRELAAGRLKPPAYECIPLAQAAEAHRLMEAGRVRGRLLLVP
jgi:NADPH2:quinone reductase